MTTHFQIKFFITFFVLSLAIVQGEESADQQSEIVQLIRQLDDDSFQSREEAHCKLLRIGKPALAAIRKAETHQSAEVRSR